MEHPDKTLENILLKHLKHGITGGHDLPGGELW
jgi:hypothetical protein